MAKAHRKIPALTAQDVARFRSFYRTVGTDDECWPWVGGDFGKGYGAFTVRHVTFRAPRIAYFIHYGVDPGPLDVLHHCDNPSCVRGSHLFLGTQQENADDCEAKGRRYKGERHHFKRNPPKGEANNRAIVTEEIVRAIRAEYVPRKVSQERLGKKYGLSRSAVCHIVSGKNWRKIQ